MEDRTKTFWMSVVAAFISAWTATHYGFGLFALFFLLIAVLGCILVIKDSFPKRKE